MRRSTSAVAVLSPGPPAATSSDINSLTSMLLLRTVRDLTTRDHEQVTPTPSTPLPAHIEVKSPHAPTPSTLTRFLRYAEDHLGVEYATSYESPLRGIGAGPDILGEMADQDLLQVGLSAGDIIRLKRGSIAWWSGPLARSKPAKRQRSDTTDSEVPEHKKFQYEWRYHDGGRARINGGCMKLDECPPGVSLYIYCPLTILTFGIWLGESPELDYDLYYFCNNRQAWVIFPPGYTFESEGDRENAEDPFI
jgi:hypothetical protein